jgi:hypothetical protein
MASNKIFGPIRGPGTRVEERPPTQEIQEGELGVIAVVGQFQRGEVNTLAAPVMNVCPGPESFYRKMGSRMDGVTAPDVCEHYFAHAQGGQILAIRVTDGLEEKAQVTLYSRHWGLGYGLSEALIDNQVQTKIPVLTVKAKNGGRWGGRKRLLTATYANSGDLTDTTLTTGITMLADELKGATLTLAGVTGRSWTVVSNSAAGVITVTTGSKMKTEYDALGASSRRYQVEMSNLTLRSGDIQSLSLQVIRAAADPTNNFGLVVRVDNQIVKTYEDLSLDPTSDYYVETIVEADDANSEIEVVDLLSGGTYDFGTGDLRPANFYAVPTTVAALTATFQPAQVVSVSSASIKVVKIEKTTVDPVPHRLTFTWVAASNKYTVAATEVAKDFDLRNLPDFSMTGGGAEYHQTYAPGALPTVKITVDHSAEPADGSTIVVDVLPVPAEALGGAILPAAKTSPLNSFRISAVTVDTVSIASGSLLTLGLAPTLASVTTTNAQAYAPSTGASDKLLISVDGRADITVTLANTDTTAALVAAKINAAFDSTFGAGVLNPASTTSDNKVKFDSLHWEKGPGSSVEFKTIANNAYTVLGLTVGVTRGVAGREMELSFAQQCYGGYDGSTPADSAYLDALDLSSSALKQALALGKGFLQITCPDKTSTDVQRRGLAFAEANNYAYGVLVPVGTTTDEGAADYIDSTIGRSDHGVNYFPSYGNIKDPDRQGSLKSVPLIGMIFGEDAKAARTNRGYHVPAAGVSVKLPLVVSLPTGKRIINEEMLSPRGLNVIKFRQGQAIVWGARTIYESAEFKFKPQRFQLSHYENVLLTNFDDIIFALNDDVTRSLLKLRLETYFKPEWQQKRALQGAKFSDACQIKIDSENNTAATAAAGDLYCDIILNLTGIVERFVIRVGKKGVSSGLSA